MSINDKENQRLRDLSKAYQMNINKSKEMKDLYSVMKLAD